MFILFSLGCRSSNSCSTTVMRLQHFGLSRVSQSDQSMSTPRSQVFQHQQTLLRMYMGRCRGVCLLARKYAWLGFPRVVTAAALATRPEAIWEVSARQGTTRCAATLHARRMGTPDVAGSRTVRLPCQDGRRGGAVGGSRRRAAAHALNCLTASLRRSGRSGCRGPRGAGWPCPRRAPREAGAGGAPGRGQDCSSLGMRAHGLLSTRSKTAAGRARNSLRTATHTP
mmetsp:Transcript_6764/g.16951  ORF Transcript_6764/g.16951 Transcript_6764/m.16951 type:complete len:226 (-) Transcript_6764:554-1231(-)